MSQISNVPGRAESDKCAGDQYAWAYGDASGLVDVQRGNAHAQLPAASITKAMLATTVVILSNSGVVDLHQPLDDVLTPDVTWLDRPTWLEALAHTAGFPFELRESWWWDDASNDLDVNAAVGEVELLQVGRWHYSNAGYQAIALALQETTGRRWDQVVHDVLWVPAGMQNTHLDTMVPPDATVRSAAGGIVTTLEDLCRFGSALAGHHPDLLPPPVLRTLTAPRAIAGPGLIQAAGLQLTVGERTQILSWGTIPDITIGLIVEPGMHSVAMSLDRFAGGEPLRAKLVETSDRLRSGFATTDLGLWWFDGQQIEVSEVEGILAARDPHSPTCLARARIEDVHISDSRVEFPRITLWREMEDSAW